MTTNPAPIVRMCPQCGATLQRLQGPDGYRVVVVLVTDERGVWLNGRTTEKRRVDAVHACPCCDYAV